MNFVKVIQDIVRLPETFYKENDTSIYSLLQETKYFEISDLISEKDILNEIKNKPQYVDSWLEWSQNKRVSLGWYFTENNNNKYIVGYKSPSKNNTNIIIEYENKYEACAAFIKREIEDINAT